MSPARSRLFAVLTVALTLALGLAGIEWALGRLGGGPALNDRLDEGMFVYHPHLGWVLAPGWRGRHRNVDFDVGYAVNRRGHRGATLEAAAPPGQRRIAYLGDSFTFGMGVDEDGTFTEVLNRADAPGTLHLNFGHPGYSTDQEVLHAEDRVFAFDPDVVVLVAFLGNDLFDNLTPYPLQVEFAKPLYELSAGTLALRNVPVPRQPKPAAVKARTFAEAIGIEAPQMPGWLARSEILRRLAGLWPPDDVSARLAGANAGSIDLFESLVARLDALCRQHDATLVVAMLPGKSYVDEPGGYSAQYQEMLRQAIIARLGAKDIPVIDAAAPLRAAYAAGRRDLFHPNEGHLTAAGNAFVAGIIGRRLAADATPRTE